MKRLFYLLFLMTTLPVCAEDVIQAVPFVTKAGVVSNDKKMIEISMSNSTFDVANLQFDILLPEGISLTGNTSFTARIPRTLNYNDELDMDIPVYDFSVQSELQTSGYTRFMFIPGGELRPIATGSGSFIKLRYTTSASMLPGVYPILMTNIKLVKTETESISIPSAVSYVVISDDGTTSPLSSEATIDLSGMTGYMPSFVVNELNTAIASNTNLKTLNLSGVTGLGGDLSVPEGAFWHTANAAKLNRTFTAGAKSTICLPFEISSSVASSLGKFYQFDGISDGKVVMRQTTGALSANTPYIYEPSSAQAGIGVTDATISFSENPVTENAEAQYTFKGTYEPITWASPVGIYGFAKAGVEGFDPGQFVRGGSGVSIAPYRAYLEYTGEGKLSAARTRGIDELPVSLGIIYIDSYGNTTIVDSAVSVVKEQAESWYGIDGTNYSGMPTRKGIYINNGKKVVIK